MNIIILILSVCEEYYIPHFLSDLECLIIPVGLVHVHSIIVGGHHTWTHIESHHLCSHCSPPAVLLLLRTEPLMQADCWPLTDQSSPYRDIRQGTVWSTVNNNITSVWVCWFLFQSIFWLIKAVINMCLSYMIACSNLFSNTMQVRLIMICFVFSFSPNCLVSITRCPHFPN